MSAPMELRHALKARCGMMPPVAAFFQIFAEKYKIAGATGHGPLLSAVAIAPIEIGYAVKARFGIISPAPAFQILA